MTKKAIAAGHICVDITPVFPPQDIRQPGDLLIPGKLLNVGPAEVSIGGAVANTGLAMKLFGADVSLMGKVGDDMFGTLIADSLKEYDADDGLIVSPGSSTSYTVVLAMPGIDRIFLHHPGANDTFSAEDIPQAMLKEAALFHFGYPPLMASMYENGGAELEEVLRRAKDAGCATSLDMAAVDPNAAAGQADWRSILERVIPYTDIFVPSAEELCFMLDRPRFAQWQTRADGRDVTEILDIDSDIVPLAEELLRMGAKIVMIKCGTPGIYLRTASADALEKISPQLELNAAAWADQCRFEKSYVPERVLSGTGAGDSCIAALLTAMLRGYGPERSLHLAAAAGACCVTSYDARGGLKTFDEMERMIDAAWAKIG